MKCMYIRHTFSGITPLEPDEELVYLQEWLPAITLYCAPINFGVWSRGFAVNATLRLTNRRLLLSGHVLLPSYRQEADLWFPGSQAKENTDLITTVSAGSGGYGPYLEIMTRNPAAPTLLACVTRSQDAGLLRGSARTRTRCERDDIGKPAFAAAAPILTRP